MKKETQTGKMIVCTMVATILISVMAFVLAMATVLEVAEPFSNLYLTAIVEWVGGLLVLEIGPWLYIAHHVLRTEAKTEEFEERLKALEQKE